MEPSERKRRRVGVNAGDNVSPSKDDAEIIAELRREIKVRDDRISELESANTNLTSFVESALVWGTPDWRLIPKALVVEISNDHRLPWDELPELLQFDVELARIFPIWYSNQSQNSVALMFEMFPMLQDDRGFWMRIITETWNDDDDYVVDLFRFNAGPAILSDHNIMLAACREYGNILDAVEMIPLATNRQFVERFLDHNPCYLKHLPLQSLRLFPDLIKKTFAALSNCKDRSLGIRYIRYVFIELSEAVDIWDPQHHMAQTWLEAGLPYLQVPIHGGVPPRVFPAAS